MTVFHTLKYPIRYPFDLLELTELPEDLFQDFLAKIHMQIDVTPQRLIWYLHTYVHHIDIRYRNEAKRKHTLLKKLIAEYEGPV